MPLHVLKPTSEKIFLNMCLPFVEWNKQKTKKNPNHPSDRLIAANVQSISLPIPTTYHQKIACNGWPDCDSGSSYYAVRQLNIAAA